MILYTDGACSGNPGPGAWATLFVNENKITQHCGFVPHATNNEMELRAVIEGLKRLPFPSDVIVKSDSAYVVGAFRHRWIQRWIENGWLNSRQKPVTHQHLWQELYDLTKMHSVRFQKVKAHANDPYNLLCDQLAKAEIKKTKELV